VDFGGDAGYEIFKKKIAPGGTLRSGGACKFQDSFGDQ
jgi:hypothetical protein